MHVQITPPWSGLGTHSSVPRLCMLRSLQAGAAWVHGAAWVRGCACAARPSLVRTAHVQPPATL